MKRRNIILNLLFLCVLVFAINIKVSAQATQVPEGYTGIYTIADLWGIRNNTSGKYILMNDIDLTEATKEGGDWDTGMGWVPIPIFSGVFDGNGYQIIGMNIYGSSSYTIGFFKELDGGTVRNLGMKDATINVSGRYIGSIVGDMSEGKIENCYFSGQIINTNDSGANSYTGGIAGYNSNGTVKNCINMGNISSKIQYVSGIVGNCSSSSSRIENCYNCGEVSGSWIYGISYGGYKSGNFYLKEKVNQSNSVNGVSPLTSTQMKYPQSFTGFDFKNTWEIDEYCNYPYPQLKNNRYIRVEKIELISAPSKLTYKQGDALDLNGAVIRVYYEDGYDTTIVPTKDMLADYDMNAIGTQTISICRGEKSVSFDIEVEGILASSIKLNQNKIEIQKSKTAQLTATVLPQNTSDKTITWSSENTLIAEVSTNGIITAKKPGTTIIKAQTTNGLTAQCVVDVKVPSVRLFLDKEQIEVMKGESEQLNITLSPVESTDSILWSSDNTNIASVIDGTVIGKKAGKTVIRVKTESGLEQKCTVVVKEDISDFKVAGIEDKKYTGQAITQKLTIYNSNTVLQEGADYTISYKNNKDVGIASLQITGKSYYVGSQAFVFSITKNSIENTTVKLSYSKCYYNGSVKCPAVSVYAGSSRLQAGQDYVCSYSQNRAPGIAYVAITGKGNFTGNKQLRFTILMPAITMKKVSALKKGKALVVYNAMKGASGYQIQYSLKNNYSAAKTKKVKTASYTLSGLKKGKKYYFRVRSYVIMNGKVYYSNWSKGKTATMKK